MNSKKNKFDYSEKFDLFHKTKLYQALKLDQKKFIKALAFQYSFTYQEFCQVVEFYYDLHQWGEMNLEVWLKGQDNPEIKSKSYFLKKLHQYINDQKKAEKVYPKKKLFTINKKRKPVIIKETKKKIWGLCPVASDKTLCCKLYTIDAVETCPFSCSYCIIQTFYTDRHVFDSNFSQKLQKVKLDKNKFYHFGSGQSSDALVWGNRNGILDALFKFAADNPNILVELKTKSNKIDYLLQKRIPRNIVCSWSLNTDVIIENEEHFTASLTQRIRAARQIADAGIKVAFHFHPMVYYKGWEREYTEIAIKLLSLFDSGEIAFISFGTVTLIRPAVRKIREIGIPTKITQMEMVPDPHGKLTYPDAIKTMLYRKIYREFQPWHGEVFIYLCMEKSSIWKNSFGYIYKNNDDFEKCYGEKTMFKLK
jgi:spore photoproduct lyase